MSVTNFIIFFTAMLVFQLHFINCVYGIFYGAAFQQLITNHWPWITNVQRAFVIYSAVFDAVLLTALYWWLGERKIVPIVLIYEFLWLATSFFIMVAIRRASNNSTKQQVVNQGEPAS